MAERLRPELREAILKPGATLGMDCVYGPEVGDIELQSDELMRALRMAARLDSIQGPQRERVLDFLAREERDRTRAAGKRAADSPELAEAHRSAADGCMILIEALNEP